MTNEETKKLALSLLHADDERAVIQILKEHNLWDEPSLWRLYGDRDSNYATIGNQQSRPEAALVEKIVNSVDARLLGECLTRGIDPESSKAPTSLHEAVAVFVEGRQLKGELGGKLEEWDKKLIQNQEQYITLSVTGAKPPEAPSLTLVDMGEGQTPGRIPETFLSIDKNNKLRIPFVQGKFNMGGTGALKFCGTSSLQLVVTRRNPAIINWWKQDPKWGSSDPRADEWGFTIVRRERPTGAMGEVRNSVYRFLAPINCSKKPGQGDVLSFRANTLKVMPDKNEAYVRDIEHGSIIKLYEYDVKGFGSHALRPDGLLSRVELLLPQIALPVRMHECRAYRGDPNRSFANTLVGVMSRLRDNPNLELNYPSSVSITVRNEKMTAQIYAFQSDTADSYRKNEGIIFMVNGQTHGAIPKTFFDRSRVKMGRIAKSLIVSVDCSGLSVGAREDLFMNSRDRLSNGELRKAVEEELEDVISKHPGLRELRERRRNKEIADRLQDSKPLENVLESILKSSPALSKLFLFGQRLSRPHSGGDTNNQGGGYGGGAGKGEFKGRPHPSFFRFIQHKYGEELKRNAELGRRCRIKFETDVENGYFERRNLPGQYRTKVGEGTLKGFEVDHNLTLFNGVANWSFSLPEDRLNIGDEVALECTVSDGSLIEPFVNVARVNIVGKHDSDGGEGHKKGREGGGEKGEGGSGPGGSGGKGALPGQDSTGGFSMPPISEVKRGDNNWIEHGFDESTASKVIDDGDESQPKLTFYVNVDNIFLRTDMKGSEADVALVKKKFIVGNVLVGLALIHEYRSRKGKSASSSEGDSDEVPIAVVVERTTRALAPFLVPMIDYLGALSLDDNSASGQRGDDE